MNLEFIAPLVVATIGMKEKAEFLACFEIDGLEIKTNSAKGDKIRQSQMNRY